TRNLIILPLTFPEASPRVATTRGRAHGETPARTTMTPRWLRGLLDALFPPRCEVCATGLGLDRLTCVCDSCLRTMPALEPPWCDRCGVPVARTAQIRSCSSCLHHPPRYASARAAALYLPARPGLNPPTPLAVAIQRLKYARRRALA